MTNIKVGEVKTFGISPNKVQALKPLEEAAEVYAAWQEWHDAEASVYNRESREFIALTDEMADVIQAVCNLAASLGLDSMELPMARCECRNRERGRCD